jgi:hypothetical protein
LKPGVELGGKTYNAILLSVAMSQAAEEARNAKASTYRSLIVDAAEGLFAERGYERTKIQDIAAIFGPLT